MGCLTDSSFKMSRHNFRTSRIGMLILHIGPHRYHTAATWWPQVRLHGPMRKAIVVATGQDNSHLLIDLY